MRVFNLSQVTSIVLAPKERIRIEVESNPTTGYSWKLDPPQSPKVIVKDLYGVYQPPQTRLMGAPGKEYFDLRCASNSIEGEEFLLHFVYQRSWEAHPIKDKYLLLKVSVESSEKSS